MQKIKKVADPKLENSISRINKDGPTDKSLRDLLLLLFEYQILEDPAEIQVKYDEIF